MDSLCSTRWGFQDLEKTEQTGGTYKIVSGRKKQWKQINRDNKKRQGKVNEKLGGGDGKEFNDQSGQY